MGTTLDKNGDRTISGLDLKVGGEWATKLYDESMVNRFNKMGKRYGVKVEKIKLPGTGHKLPDWKREVEPIVDELHELAPESDMYHKEIDEMGRALVTGNYAGARNRLEVLYTNHAMTLEEADEIMMNKLDDIINKGEGATEVKVHSLKITPEMKESIGKSRFHPFADLPGPKPKASPAPAAVKSADFNAEAAALDPANPVRYAGDMGGYPMFQQEPPGVGSFIQRPGETVAAAFERAKARYQK
jgi:hypothetical protein